MFVYPHSPSNDDLKQLQARLGVTFHNEALLLQALTHRSWIEEKFPGGRAPAYLSQGRLAFLGDAKLGEVVARTLFFAHPTTLQGGLTDAATVFKRGSWLITCGRALGLDALLRAGRGGAANLMGNPKVIEDTMEAVLGALVADGQPEAVERIVTGWIAAHAPTVAEAPAPEEHPNPIGAINELYLQHQGRPAPKPQATSSGPDHALVWEVTLDLTDFPLSVYWAAGSSVHTAHEDACRQALRDYYALARVLSEHPASTP